MVDVISHHLFPTVIHEFNLDIDALDKKHMIEYIKRGQVKPNGMIQTEDDLHVMSYFKKLEFFDPRSQALVLCPRIKTGNVMNANAVGFAPRENMGLIFPSWLQHWVKTSDSDERMSVSWNTLTKGHYGGPLGKANAYI